MIVTALLLAATINTTSACEVTRTPASFDGKRVRIRATVISGFEIFGIRDPDDAQCETIWLTYASGGPVASTSFGGSAPQPERAPVRLQKDRAFAKFQKLLSTEMYPRGRDVICMSCDRYEVTATLTGRLDYATRGGFGHLNGFKTQLVLESVSDVSAKDVASQYDANDFSATRIRFPGGSVAGSVIDRDGRPIVLAPVNATSTEDVPPYMKDFHEWTDEKGSYKFADLPPGTYRIGINVDSPPSPKLPYATTFIPK
ncbi:MAG TPA: carboxypeptidase-like regulatory domain-containing protein [Thermoanaerobaculia bacterium]|nr:carboxypeptidase-like regulatory domain-containing protein [Thermoanaerobaculia bacterium]